MRLGLKILLVLGMTLAILVPLSMIRGTIHERQAYRETAVTTVARSYAGEQAITGPVLVVPYVETVVVEQRDPRGDTHRVRREQAGQWTYFPTTMETAGKLLPSTRRLGIHEVRVYEFNATTDAVFNVRIPGDAGADAPRRLGRPRLVYGFSDVRGLVGAPMLKLDGHVQVLQQGLGGSPGSGVHAELAVPQAGQTLHFQSRIAYALGGTESLSIAPLGKSNRIVIDSSWPHPQFNGAFLPRSKRIDGNGFHAQWDVSSLATNAQAQYIAGSRSELDRIGVSMVEPVNIYSQADRATKYGLLFVALTFVGFFMFELIRQLRIHPIQYALVGLALSIFFLLLVSLSEHIAFGWAYLAASVACIGLLGFYLSAVMQSVARGIGFSTMLALLYGALYGLLVSEDNALVLGAGLLFVILSVIMVVTRRIDWYRVSTMGAGS